tara:strand:+ start:4068 stop:4757 length:690 start_codon:yes stop_codon:yes gene_type:complete
MTSTKPPEIYSFCDDGYNLPWQLGIAYYMNKKKVFSENAIFTGYGTGLLSAISLGCNIPLLNVRSEFKKIIDEQNKLIRINILWTKCSQHLINVLQNLLQHFPNAYISASNKVNIPIQKMGQDTYWISTFNSNQDIIDAYKQSIIHGTLGKSQINNILSVPIRRKLYMHELQLTISYKEPNKSQCCTFVLHSENTSQILWDENIPKCNIMSQRQFKSGYEDAKKYFTHC